MSWENPAFYTVLQIKEPHFNIQTIIFRHNIFDFFFSRKGFVLVIKKRVLYWNWNNIGLHCFHGLRLSVWFFTRENFKFGGWWLGRNTRMNKQKRRNIAGMAWIEWRDPVRGHNPTLSRGLEDTIQQLEKYKIFDLILYIIIH
jgi:hypothetical protein